MAPPGWTPPGSWRCCSSACPPGPAGGFPHPCCGTRTASIRSSCCSFPCWRSRCRRGGCLHRREFGVAIVSAIVIFARAFVIITAALRALKLRWNSILPYAARGLGLAAVCGGAVLAGQHAVANLTFPGVSLYAGSACAVAAMLLMVGARPQVLGEEAQSALARLVPRFALRWTQPRPATDSKGSQP